MASFVSPYALIGRGSSVSTIGTEAGSPYTAQVDEKTSRRTPASTIAPNSASDPATLFA